MGWRPTAAVAVVALQGLLVGACASDDGDASRVTRGSTTTSAATTFDATDPVGGLQRMLDGFLAETAAPGGVIGVARGDDDPIFVTSGVANPGTTTAVSTDDLFLVASNTKIFTGVLVLLLVEDGLVELDAAIDSYLPGWPHGDEVTIRHLLTHTSGYPSWCDDGSPACVDAIVADFGRVFTLDETLAFTRGEALLFDPGTSVHYSNVNSYLLGKIAETVTGRPLVNLYRAELLDPLGLENTFYAHAEALPRPPDGGTFELEDGDPLDFGVIPHEAALSMVGPAGAMASTVGDLLTWGRALWRDGGVLQPATLALATDLSSIGTGLGVLGFSLETNGFCVFSGCPSGTTFVGPGGLGEIPGTMSTLVYDVERDVLVSVIVTSNIDVPVQSFTAQVLQALRGT